MTFHDFALIYLGMVIGTALASTFIPWAVARAAWKRASSWEAVARNIAASHPEGREVFLRVAQAHGLEVTQ